MATETVNVNATAINAAITAEAAARVAGDAASVATAASDATTKANAAQAAAIAAAATDATTKANAAQTAAIASANAHSDGLVVGLFDDRGAYDASGNVYPTTGGSGTAGAVLKGDVWRVSVAGVLGGDAVSVGDSFRALTDTPGQTSSNWLVFLQADEQATETRRGTLGIATQAEVEDAVSTNDIDAITPKKWWQAFAYAVAQTAFNTLIRSIDLTGYVVGANTALAASDTFLGAFQKLQGQVNAINTAVSANTTAISGKLTASNNLSDVNAASARTNLGLWNTVMKTSTETRTTNTVLAADSVLKLPMAANTKYAIRMTVFVDSLATPDFKFRLSGPASPTLVRSWMVLYGGPASGGTTASSATSRLENTYSASDISIVSAADQLGAKLGIDMIIHNGANAGDFEFQWAQNTSNAGATSVLAGSCLEWRQE